MAAKYKKKQCEKKIEPKVVVQQVKVEIDYSKLADAICHAQKVKPQKPHNTRFRNRIFRTLNGCVYAFMGILPLITIEKIWKNKELFPALLWRIVATVLCIFFSLCFFFCQQETFDDDYDATTNQFNTIVSFAALIISVIAFLKGVD